MKRRAKIKLAINLVLLRRAFESGFRTVAHWASSDSAFDRMRGDEEFQKFLAELH